MFSFFNLCYVVYKILCWENISKFHVAKIKYPCTVKTTTNTSVNSQDNTWNRCYIHFTENTVDTLGNLGMNREPELGLGYTQHQNSQLSICHQDSKKGQLIVSFKLVLPAERKWLFLNSTCWISFMDIHKDQLHAFYGCIVFYQMNTPHIYLFRPI